MKKQQKKPNTKETFSIQGPWQLQTAKARFSEVFRLARSEGPQLITRQGKEGVIMLPVEQYEQLVASTRQPIVDFFRASPLFGLDLDLERDRDRDVDRDIEL